MLDNPPRTFYQKWSVGILLVTLVLLPFSFYFAGRAVQSNVNRVEDWLPKSFQETENLAWFRRNFASDQFIIVSWQGCQLGSEDAGTQDDPRLERLANLLVPSSPDESSGTPPPAERLDTRDDLDRRKYFKSVVTGRHILDRLTSQPLSLPTQSAISRLQGSMIGPDGRQTCLVLTLRNEALSELRQILGHGQRRLFRENVPPGILRRLIAQAGIPADDVHLGGPPVDNSAIDEEGEKTLIRLAGLSGILGLGLAWCSLRSVPLTLLVFFCGVVSAATSLAIVGISGQNLDAILMSMPSLVYVLAISGAVHLINYYREAIRSQGLYAAAERAVVLAWKPAVLCSVTTAVGLLSLSVSELVPIRKFGIFSAAGVLSLVAIVYFFLPAALQLSRIGKRWLLTDDRDGAPSGASNHSSTPAIRFWGSIASLIVDHHRLVAVLCLAVAGFVGYGLRYTNSSIDLLKLFDQRARILQDYRWLEANLGKLVPLEIIVRFPPVTQRELELPSDDNDWNALSFVQRLETVTRMQALIDRKFGPDGADLVGRSLSAASFAPSLPSATAGNMGFIQRKAINARLSRSKQELSQAGFLRIDSTDGSELWRISLRVAAFRDVDYGQFVKDLEEITQPLLVAYETRANVLSELARLAPENSPAGKKVLLWSYCAQQGSEQVAHETFQIVLHRLLEEYRCTVTLFNEDPSQTPLTELESLDRFDAVVTFGDFTNAHLDVIRTGLPDTIDVRLQDSLDHPLPGQPADQADRQLSAIYTGVVPIVYQAQRALLNSLMQSTWWSFLTITPIMMLVSRSLLAGAIAMIPNAVPVLLIFGGMGWLGIAIDIGSMMTASIALGVAVDDTIHFLARYRDELAHSPNRKSAIVATYSHCAIPTLQAALISGLGLSVFAFSTFTPTQKFGWLMLSILLAGVASELILLPALLASPLGCAFRIRQPHTQLGSRLLAGTLRTLRLDSAHKPSFLSRKIVRSRNRREFRSTP